MVLMESRIKKEIKFSVVCRWMRSEEMWKLLVNIKYFALIFIHEKQNREHWPFPSQWKCILDIFYKAAI